LGVAQPTEPVIAAPRLSAWGVQVSGNRASRLDTKSLFTVNYDVTHNEKDYALRNNGLFVVAPGRERE
jgi:hypothetical protein